MSRHGEHAHGRGVARLRIDSIRVGSILRDQVTQRFRRQRRVKVAPLPRWFTQGAGKGPDAVDKHRAMIEQACWGPRLDDQGNPSDPFRLHRARMQDAAAAFDALIGREAIARKGGRPRMKRMTVGEYPDQRRSRTTTDLRHAAPEKESR